MDRRRIELVARDVQVEIWKERNLLFPMGVPSNPRNMLEPEIAANVLGVASYGLSEGLGCWGRGSESFEIAGLLDQQRGLIRVSTKFRYEVMRFTGAHELGHVALRHKGHVWS